MIQRMLAIWSLVLLPFLKPAWTSGSSQFTYCWSLAWRILSITLLACEMSATVQLFEHSLTLPFLGSGMKTDLFQSCGHCWVFQICWHVWLLQIEILEDSLNFSFSFSTPLFSKRLQIKRSYQMKLNLISQVKLRLLKLKKIYEIISFC